jgi:predicted DNA-binding transcriptional regulator YafY
MRRADRLFELLQLFRGARLLTGQTIADRLRVHVRTVYRDIDALVANGVPIEGERGVGYVLREPIFLPPLTLTPRELEALHLGVALVDRMTDPELAAAARKLLVKIDSVLPSNLPRSGHDWGVAIYQRPQLARDGALLTQLRQAIRRKEKLSLGYTRLDGTTTQRVVRPLQVEFWGNVWTCTTWCEARADFRVFRLDRIGDCVPTGERFRVESGKRLADYLAGLFSSKPASAGQELA